MHTGNFYRLLQVPEDAEPAAIRHAFRVLARRFHPDAGLGSSVQKFRDVTEAYDVLSDPQRRREHDIDLARSRAHAQVRAEPLIPDRPTRVTFRHSAFGFDREIENIFQILDQMFEQMW
jgi:curved DNA-binding protein CbpA